MRVAWLVLSSSLWFGCTSTEDPAPEPPSDGAAGAAAESTCAGRGRPLRPQLVRSADDVDVELLSLEPEAPVVGDNTWRLRLTRSDEALEGATLSVRPWMPDHEHASTKIVRVSELEAGTYRLSPVYLGMVGYWEIGIELTIDGEALGSVSFDTCLSRE